MPVMAIEVNSAYGDPERVETVRTLMREYAALPHVAGRWTTIAEDIAALPHPYVPPRGALLLAQCDGRPVGCAALGDLGDGIGELKRMYVQPSARRAGVGSALLQALLDHAERAGYERVRLDTAPELHAAIALYERFGFTPIPSYRTSECLCALYFERALPPRAS